MRRSAVLRSAVASGLLLACACTTPQRDAAAPAAAPRHLVLITIDTLRADRVGAYGYARARTPTIDASPRAARDSTRAFATAPITLPSHASLMTGRYPPGHGARHNGMRVDASVPTLAKTLSAAGFATGAFVSAFPLDRRFGLNAGFDVYGDRLPRALRGRPVNERPGARRGQRSRRVARDGTLGSRRALSLAAPLRAARAVRPRQDRSAGCRSL